MGAYLITLEPIILGLHYITAVFAIIVILLQSGKGMGIGSMFGAGGSQSLFGARGAGNFLTKLTVITALVFLFTSLSLATVANHKVRGGAGNSVMDQEVNLTNSTTTEDGNVNVIETIPNSEEASDSAEDE